VELIIDTSFVIEVLIKDSFFEINGGIQLSSLKDINKFLNSLDQNNIYYRLNKIRTESIMIEVAVPAQRWEIEFMDNGTVEIEKFISDGSFYDGEELEVLLNNFSD